FVYEMTDCVIPGAGIDFAFRRTYRSKAIYDGPLGSSWDHSYNLWIGKLTDTMLVASTGTLQQFTYSRHPNYGQEGFSYWVPPDGLFDVIVASNDSFERRTPDGSHFIYEPHGSVEDFHRLARIVDRFGNFLSFQYNGDLLDYVIVNNELRL